MGIDFSSPVSPSTARESAAPELSPDGGKIEEAARQFESLLMAELLRASRGDETGWLGTGDDPSMSSATDMAQEYLAQAMTVQGGLGITQYVKEHLAGTVGPRHSRR